MNHIHPLKPAQATRNCAFGLCAAMLLAASLLAGAMMLPVPASAQSSATVRKAGPVMVCPDIPNAECIKEPSPDTPVAPEYQESYKTYMAEKAAAHGGRKLTWSNLPDWSGIWTRVSALNWDPSTLKPGAPRQGNSAQSILDHCKTFPCEGFVTAPLRPAYALKFREKLTGVAHGFEWDQLTDCLPTGWPRDIFMSFQHEDIVTPGTTWIISEQQSEVRRIYTDGRGHVPQDEAYPLWDGDSIGFWDGDTLVVHTINMKAEEIQRLMPSTSGEASTIEHMHLVGPNRFRDSAVLYDSKSMTKPWPGYQEYGRVTKQNDRIDMWSCEENQNVIQAANGRPTFVLPGETIMIKRSYRDPATYNNQALNNAIAFGAKIMKEEEMKKAAGKDAKSESK